MYIGNLQINTDMNRLSKQTRHPRVGGDPSVAIQWIPAFAGMTLGYRYLFVKTQFESVKSAAICEPSVLRYALCGYLTSENIW